MQSQTAALTQLWDRPYELLGAMQARLQSGGERVEGAPREWTGLAFTLAVGGAGAQFVAPRDDVSEVLEVPELTRVPRARPWLLGVANVRGDLLPVIDPGRLLGRDQTLLTERSRVVVLNDEDTPAGFVVDDVAGFRSFAVQDQRHTEIDADEGAPIAPFLLGAFVRDGETWRVFSLRKLAGDPALADAGV